MELTEVAHLIMLKFDDTDKANQPPFKRNEDSILSQHLSIIYKDRG